MVVETAEVEVEEEIAELRENIEKGLKRGRSREDQEEIERKIKSGKMYAQSSNKNRAKQMAITSIYQGHIPYTLGIVEEFAEEGNVGTAAEIYQKVRILDGKMITKEDFENYLMLNAKKVEENPEFASEVRQMKKVLKELEETES